jgi:hypothetical protein
LKFKYDGYISDNQRRPPLPTAKKVMFKLSPKNYQVLSRSPSYSGSFSSKNSSKVITTKPSSRKGDRQIKNLLIHKNEGLLKKIMREWHLYSLRQFKKRMTTHIKKKKRLQTSVPKKKKKSARRFETEDSECRSINI